MRGWRLCLGAALVAAVAAPAPVVAQDGLSPADRQLARDIFRELIEINTTDSLGNTPRAARAMAARLRVAGFPAADVQVLIGPDARHGNLVARLRGSGTGGRPIVSLAHLDVVPARRSDWSVDPFTLLERDGYFYGRGTTDDKVGDAILVADFIRLRREGFRPTRDLILALTGDEETDGSCIQWLLKAHRDLVDAEFALNTDAGGGVLRDGRRVMFAVQASEKVYATYVLEAVDKGGHSSLPRPAENPIYRLAPVLERLAHYQFPVKLNEVSRAFFEQSAAIETGQLADDMRGALKDPPDSAAVTRLSAVPFYNSKLRTTCVATMMDAGHAENALPQSARATVNCRILPGEPVAEVEATLRRLAADDRITIRTTYAPTPSPASPLTPAIMGPIGRLVAEQFPSVPVVPFMEAGATDGLFLRNAGIPTYGVSAVFEDQNDVRAHGRDERIRVESFYEALQFWYRMMRVLAGAEKGERSAG
ncbi:MAG TPA: M20/M25/M40 family metallo-hydrolase [Gemmatimonadales bacterium]|nr:M20/M25/M40 family metallo-hydrolase [Gemmatimonadales bacterium]